MPTLEELLRESLKGTNAKFETARADLNAAVLELRAGVEAVSNGKVTVALEENGRTEVGTRYTLVAYERSAQRDARYLTEFLIRPTGYPISSGGPGVLDGIDGKFQTAEALTDYIRKLATGDSPLVVYLAHALRQPAHSAG